jgi:SAM-dependent methyltransferase
LEIEKYKAPSTILFRGIELKLLKEKVKRFSKSGVILDLGCGEGLTALLVFGKRIDYGLDNDRSFVRLARKSGVYKQVLFADARDIPLESEGINLVFSNCVIEHIKDLNLVLNEVSRVLKKGGYFIFTTPSNNFAKYSIFSRLNIKWISRVYGRLRNKKFAHYNCHSLTEWKRILNKYGLTVVDGYYYIDKKTAEFWDFLLFFRFYPKFIRQRIYKYYKKAKAANSTGAAVAVFAQKT